MSPLARFSLCLIQTKSAQKNQRGHRIGEVLHFKLVFKYWECTGEMDDMSYGDPVGWALLNEEKAGDTHTNKKDSKNVLEEMINFFVVVKTTLILFSVGSGHV